VDVSASLGILQEIKIARLSNKRYICVSTCPEFRSSYNSNQKIGVTAMMSQNFDLSLEQQFSVRSFQSQIQDMSREQAQEFLVQLYSQLLWQESTYKNLLKHQWGIGDCSECPGCANKEN
jgi:7-cyano-7-deazaguanine synthase in queuosine biosynthesis